MPVPTPNPPGVQPKAMEFNIPASPKTEKASKTVVRKYPASVEIHVPTPAAAGSPFKRPRFWHTLHRNNIARLMYAAGFELAKYRFVSGEGASMVFHSWAVESKPGEIPAHVQSYLEAHFGGSGWEYAKAVVNGMKPLLNGIATIFPAAGPAIAIINGILGIAYGAMDNIDGDK